MVNSTHTVSTACAAQDNVAKLRMVIQNKVLHNEVKDQKEIFVDI